LAAAGVAVASAVVAVVPVPGQLPVAAGPLLPQAQVGAEHRVAARRRVEAVVSEDSAAAALLPNRSYSAAMARSTT
jgi:hypothetical protein